ncbi:MAG: ABC transporter ATP-binding protein, partial [Chlamydiia bacterium]|nr:ABC transporter ATP-binding protein [Chlamydiia bacterium]
MKQLTQEVEGKVFQVHGVGEHKRRLLVDLAQAGPILDATLQGDLVRVVTREENAQKGIEALCGNADYTIVPCPPRFEDAFINRLGGVQEHLQLDYQLPNGKSATPPVEARNLSKRFGSFTAVNQINFSMQRGEIFGLLGPNGAGKSTTFKMLCGLLKASSGDPFVEGIPMIQAPSHARAQIGYMAQGFSLYNNLTVLQNLRFFGGSYAVPNLGQRIDALLSTFGLIPYTDTYPKTLPLGLKQRLALCCALLHHPPILFLDEPTAGVDPLTRREFWLHINNLTRNGASVLVSTHLMDEAEFCDRIGFIYEGQLKVVGTPSELRAYGKSASTPNPTLTDAFLALCGTPEKQGGN